MKPYYSDETITIYHGDSRDILGEVYAAVMVSDPPYGMAYQSGWKDASSVAGDMTTDARDRVVEIWGDKPALLFGRWSVPRPAKTRELLIWDKGDWPGMGDLSLPWGPSTEEIYVLGKGFVGKRSGQIIRDPKRPKAAGYHPTEKPVGLMEILVKSCPPGVVADPFMGSGTTLVACRNLGRHAIGIEIEEKYCEIAVRRISQLSLFGPGGA